MYTVSLATTSREPVKQVDSHFRDGFSNLGEPLVPCAKRGSCSRADDAIFITEDEPGRVAEVLQ